LLLLGVLASFVYSAYSVFADQGHVYFEVGCVILVAISLGRWLEASGKLQTTAELRRLQNLLPDVVCRVSNQAEEQIALHLVEIGDVLRVLPGETIAADGQITRGAAAIDECMVSGESTPINKHPGDIVHSGTTNLDGELLIQVQAAPGAGTIERLIAAVLQAVQGRSRLERLAERIAKLFLPAILLISLATLAWHTTHTSLAAGILNGLAVVVISCPCALGLATPMALWAAIGETTRRHLLVRDGDAFSRLTAATIFCFDKTGTLTHGCQVAAMRTSPSFATDDCLAIATALARTSHHPLSEAIVAYAAQQDAPPAELASVRAVAGRGVRGSLPSTGQEVMLGSAEWLRSLGIDVALAESNSTTATQSQVLLACDGRVAAVFAIQQRVRQQARAALEALRAIPARTLMLSGDEHHRAAEIATDLGCEVIAPLLPEQKLQAIRDLQAQGHCVVMVGDGLNDAPALAAADVGIVLGCGADVSRWSGSVCLLNDDLSALPWLVEFSRRTSRTIRWNLLWAFGYNAVCIPLAAAGWLHPAMAAAAMVASSLLVVSNSLRLANSSAAPTDSQSATEPLGTSPLTTTPAWESAA
ncbi:MAG TPA: cation-translocating P-type ATPase, partial [Pirellulaceae bacterium]|nr:cation-translocating P-type ATPase [Pirellulaceae bacterium]